MGATNLVTPETAPDGNDGELGQDDGAADGGGHLLGAFDAETDVPVVVSDGDESLEAGALTGTSLLLDRHDLEDFVLQGGSQEKVDDLRFLKWILKLKSVRKAEKKIYKYRISETQIGIT